MISVCKTSISTQTSCRQCKGSLIICDCLIVPPERKFCLILLTAKMFTNLPSKVNPRFKLLGLAFKVLNTELILLLKLWVQRVICNKILFIAYIYQCSVSKYWVKLNQLIPYRMTIGHIINNLRTKKFSQVIQSIFRILTPLHVFFSKKRKY